MTRPKHKRDGSRMSATLVMDALETGSVPEKLGSQADGARQANATDNDPIYRSIKPSVLASRPHDHGAHSRSKLHLRTASLPNSVAPSSPFASFPTKTPVRTSRRWHRRLTEASAFWLLLYFLLNLGLTLYNKTVLNSFPFPYTLTALHSLFAAIGGEMMRRQGLYTPATLSRADKLVLAGFSVLYALNIAISNVSLEMVTVPFHQVVRSTTPAFALALSTYLFAATYTRAKVLALVPVMLGVALATYGDYSFTFHGLVFTLFGTLLAALKTILTGHLQKRRVFSTSSSMSISSPPPFSISSLQLGLHPHDLLARMSPIACAQCLFFAWLADEPRRVASEAGVGGAVVLVANGALACALNIVSFSANRRAGALAMTVAGNVKQVLTVLLAVSLFDLTLTRANVVGIALALGGGAFYAWVEYHEKHGVRRHAVDGTTDSAKRTRVAIRDPNTMS